MWGRKKKFKIIDGSGDNGGGFHPNSHIMREIDDVYLDETVPGKKTKKKCFIYMILIAIVLIVAITLIVLFAVPEDVKNRVKHKITGHGNDNDGIAYRLPSDVLPISYKLILKPDIDSFSFDGSVAIQAEITKGVHEIVLNSVDLHIKSVHISFDATTNETIEIHDVRQSSDGSQQLILSHKRISKAGEGTLINITIDYSGQLTDSLSGFYRSSYKVDDNEATEWLAVTDFEPTDARRAFPCFDEPSMKATFDISVLSPPGYSALSNADIGSIAPAGGKYKWFHFQRTPRMSTYLVCVCVSKFQFTGASASNGRVAVRVWTRKEVIYQAEYAAWVAASVLEYYEAYFGIDYPLSKLDLIGIPDFSAGAMENWGCITFRETALLFDENKSSIFNKQRVASTIAHEIAHQWFGDLVTMKWWDDLWLNEGFATYMSYVGLDYIHPSWHIWDQFLIEDQQRALSDDALSATHPIHLKGSHVKRPSDIGQLFDAISYSKGASIIRMLQAYLGENLFRRGLNLYLSSHAYGNAETEDLWKALQNVSSIDVPTIMEHWVSIGGYPEVFMQLLDDSKIRLTQSRSILLEKKSDSTDKWWIPFTVYSASVNRTATITREMPVLMFNDVTFLWPDIRENNHDDAHVAFLQGNIRRTGFYRVRYDDALMGYILDAQSQGALNRSSDIVGMLNDAFSYTYRGQQTISTLFRMINGALSGQKNYGIWHTSLSILASIRRLVPEARLELDKQIVKLVGSMLPYVGWSVGQDDSHETRLLRPLLLDAAVSYGHQEAINKTLAMFEILFSGSGSVHPDLLDVVYRAAIQRAPTTELLYRNRDWMLIQYMNSDVAAERRRALSATAYARDSSMLQYMLDMSLSASIRRQDTAGLLIRIAANPLGTNIAYDFLKANHEALYRRYGSGHFTIESIVRGLTSRFQSRKKLDDVKKFFREHPIDAASNAIKASIELIKIHMQWLDYNREALCKFIQCV